MHISSATVTGGFWRGYRDVVRGPMLLHQWEALNDRIEGAAPSQAVNNLKKAAGLLAGDHTGPLFTDSDLAKWLEAAAFAIGESPDEKLVVIVEEVIDLYEKAQMTDGYINSFYQLTHPEKRWSNLQSHHELYCIGHLIEAAVAYQRATGNSRLTNIAIAAVNSVRSAIGPEAGKIRGYPGHEEIELALVKLADLTGDRAYLDLARYFVDERGVQPLVFDLQANQRGEQGQTPEGSPPSEQFTKASQSQSHLPVREQSEAIGHSVRAMYLYAAMADLALRDADDSLADACRRVWASATRRRMYVTGAIGSTKVGEAFTYDYDLPGDIAYAETCAAIGLVIFANRMLKLEARGEYGDVLERALYNGVLSGMSLDGKGYFYVNPLVVSPIAAEKKPETARARPHRTPWKGCACCPPNIARIIASVHDYAWSVAGDTIFTHLYLAGAVTVEVPAGAITFTQKTDYPWAGSVTIQIAIDGSESVPATLALRIPDWCENPALKFNGEALSLDPILENGYAYVRRDWVAGDIVRLELPMIPRRVYGAPRVGGHHGKGRGAARTDHLLSGRG